MRKHSVCFLLCFLLFQSYIVNAQKNIQDMRWKNVAAKMPEEWYGTPEARSVAEQVLQCQTPYGGWPKNIEMHRPVSDQLLSDKKAMRPTLDNNATTTEMVFMARMYQATEDFRYRESFEKGLEYILEAQYEHGGWPQFYPLRGGYYDRITYNDNAQVNIMRLLKDIFDDAPLYDFVATPEMKRKARQAFDKGVENILQTQIYVDGQPTVWCAQHDEVTFKPAKARAYELPSFSGAESASIVLLLMNIPNPSPELVASIEGAVRWFETHKIEGIRLERNLPDGSEDLHVVKDPEAPAIWARFYDLETQQPIFIGRDGIKKATLSEIEYERRNGYGYYTDSPRKVLNKYPKWKKKWSK